jgi:cyanophycin synthetase
MNIFNFREFKFMVDFAHNPDGFNGVKEFLRTVDSPQKIGLIAGTGDRRDEDIRELGAIAATMFDHILLRQADHLRGRTRENILSLIEEGILSVKPDAKYEILLNEVNAIPYAISLAKPGAFITMLSDVVENGLEIVQNLLEEDRSNTL